MTPTLVYLASPYSNGVKAVRNDRHLAAITAYRLLCEKYPRPWYQFFSPITHSHNIAEQMGNQLDAEYWITLDMTLLNRWADELWVLMMDGWEDSRGIAVEMSWARVWKKPIRCVEFDEHGYPVSVTENYLFPQVAEGSVA